MVKMDLSETPVKESLSLYDGDVLTYPSVQDGIEDMEYYLDGNGDYHPVAGLSSGRALVTAPLSHFGYWVIERQEARAASLDLSQRIQFLLHVGEHFLFESNPRQLTPPLAGYGETLLQLIATGRDDLRAPTEEIALAVLQSGRYEPPEGSTGYFTRPSRIGVFALEALAAARGEAIDWESFHVPPDRFWLDAARIGLTETDPARAAEWARELCDAQLQTLQTDQENFSTDVSSGHEISQEAHFLWPIAAISFLRLRDSLGLETAPVEHPLMETSFRGLQSWVVPPGSWPGAPWYSEILDKTAAAAPELAPRLKVIR
ncbi:hypothetical protein [Oceanicola sp. 502str15]|uniref:hypothetical protein n=1 Tax=Oceanicola sp. 502str15 TaxID=2696061 RepID=UPI0020941AB9|nr:hypothetical protein [Oceanicola sp. 502str15]